MTDLELDKAMLRMATAVHEELERMDDQGFGESVCICLVCGHVVRVCIRDDGDAEAWCETSGCFESGTIHRRRQTRV